MGKENIQGILESSRRITASFSTLKVIAVVSVIAAAAVAMFSVYYTWSSLADVRSRIYVLDKGQVLTASEQDSRISREDEIKDNMDRFHNLFFSVSPNADVLKADLEKALNMSDRSVYDYYNDLAETGFYKRMVAINATQQVQVDSVAVDMSSYPYPVTTYCTQYITRESTITQYSLVTKCRVLEVNRTPVNLHGLQIEKFSVVKNEELKTVKRY